MDIKYLTSYHGPSYGSMDQIHMDGATSLYDAMQRMRQIQRDEAATTYTYEENLEGVYLPWDKQYGHYVSFPATTREDYMDVCYAIPESTTVNGEEVIGYVLGDWAYRISVGPRGGIRSDKA